MNFGWDDYTYTPKKRTIQQFKIIMENINIRPILDKYDEKCAAPSDINELLPYLKQYADLCDTICEMGVRNPTSTYAFLASNPKRLVSYDIGRYPEVDEVERLAKEAGIDFEFRLENVLEADIEETDMLFIDTYHTATQLERELARHSEKIKKYIGFHDVSPSTFWDNGEPHYPGVPSHVACGRGLRHAIEPFMANHPEWVQEFLTHQNNGLLILKRV